MERQYTRVDTIRTILDNLLNGLEDAELRRNGYVHLYGVGQAAAMLALKRGQGRKVAELAVIAGMLHDYTKYFVYDTDDHAHLSEPYVRKVLEQTGEFSEQEINMVCQGVYNHSDKSVKGEPFDEIIKDADAIQHYLRNPMEDFWFERKKVQEIVEELGL